MSLISPLKLNIADKLEKNAKFRKRFFCGQAQDKIAMDIRKLRKKREMIQSDLADKSDMRQSSISRIEQADYSGWSMNTLFRVADALEARLTVSFEPMEDVIDWYRKKEEEATIDNNQFVEISPSNVPKDLDGTVTDYSNIIKFPQYIVAVSPELCGQALQR